MADMTQYPLFAYSETKVAPVMTALFLLSVLLFLLAAGVLALRLRTLDRQLDDARARLEEQADYCRLAFTDTLTGLPNRRAFQHALERLEGSGRSVCLALLDLNGLKRVNDSQGHLAGDALLQRTAGQLLTLCPPLFQAFRIGGDEFVLLGTELSQAEAESFFPRLLHALDEAGADAALGWCLGPAAGPEDLQALLRESDRRMYTQKQERRGVCSNSTGHRSAPPRPR